MTRTDAASFVEVLKEPALVLTAEGHIIAKNESFFILIQRHGLPEDAKSLHAYLKEGAADVNRFLALGAKGRSAIPGGFTLHRTDVNGNDHRCRCECALLRPRNGEESAWLFLRMLPTSEASQRFRALSDTIEELHGEVHRRREVEKALREAQITLEDRVAERTIDLERLNRDLRRSNQALEDFAYVASHDLQEPLRKIQVFAEMLEDTLTSEIAEGDREMLDRLIGAAGRMQRLVTDLLEYSRVSTKPQLFDEVDLSRTIDQVKIDLELRITETGARIETSNLPVVRGDPIQIYQLFQNLVLNSLKFRREGVTPRITISGIPERADEPSQSGQLHEIILEDNGMGFEAEFADRIFQPFQRLNPRHEYEGTGIGLTICRKIVERHDGTIHAEGRPGEGARFVMRFPKEAGSEVLSGTSREDEN